MQLTASTKVLAFRTSSLRRLAAIPSSAPSPLRPRTLAMVAHAPSMPLEDSSSWQYVHARDSTVGHFVYAKQIQTSEQDDRLYKIIRLENGLQAVLVHDAKADKAAASLNVAVGHLNDPDDMPGLAHFCEHLLFMGTEQYPKENEYSEYLAKNGGHSNAYTAAHNTNYYFNVGTEAFGGALERFSGFFHSPLFDPSCTTREINAVDSENKKNLHQDMWRIFQLNKHLSKPGHPWSKFGSGNRTSLTATGRALKAAGYIDKSPEMANRNELGIDRDSPSSQDGSRTVSPTPSSRSEDDVDGGIVGRETRRRLVDWWSQEYCASRMGLALVGKASLDELTELTTKLFSPILNRQKEPLPNIPDHPFGPDEMGTIVHVKTIMDFQAFELSFPLPDQAPLWQIKPGNFLGHFVGHEGPGSLCSYLKNKGWITGLSSGPQTLGRGFAMFKITVHLTKDGFRNFREAILACHKYLSLLRSSAFPEWYQREIQLIHNTRFRFAEKYSPDTYASNLSLNLHWPYPREMLLTGPALVFDWDEKLVRDTLAGLTVDTGRVVVMAKDHGVVGQDGEWQKEPWYGTEYKVYKVDEDLAARARTPNDMTELYLPGKNEFIPTNVEVEKREASEPLKRPILIKKTGVSSVWHKKDDQFWVPKAHLMIDIRSPIVNQSARTSVMARLYADLIVDSLTELVYDADLAGLHYGLDAHAHGLSLSVSGYNDKLHLLTRRIMERVKHISIRPDRLAIVKEQVALVWQNFFLDQSYRLADYYGRYLLDEGRWTLDEKLTEVSEISLAELEKFAQDFLSRVNINVLVSGNLRKEEASDISAMVEDVLATQPLPENEIPHRLSLILPEGCNYIWQKNVSNANETNSGLTYYCHVGDIIDPRLRVTFGLLSHLISEPAFNVLRTKEQLGYIVSAASWRGTGSMGLRIVVQSEKDPKYLETRVDAFLGYMTEYIANMPDAEFEEQRKGLIRKWTEKLKNLSEETSRFWVHIESGYLDFHRRERDATILETVTREEILALHKLRLDPSSPQRSKLSVHLRPQKVSPRKFSIAASQAYRSLLVAHGVVLDEGLYAEKSAAEPPIVAVKAHWSNMLLGQQGVTAGVKIDPAVARMLVDAVEEIGAKYPAVGEGLVQLKEDTMFIEDTNVFKEGLRVSEPPRPVEPFHDLPISKF